MNTKPKPRLIHSKVAHSSVSSPAKKMMSTGAGHVRAGKHNPVKNSAGKMSAK